MALNTRAILNAVQSHAMKTGQFEATSLHEPKNAPGQGLRCAVWVDQIGPARGQSGLRATTARLALAVRIYTPVQTEPQDEIDPRVMDAVDALMTAYSGDFDLDGLVRNVDLLGATGDPLSARAGYLQAGTQLQRVMTITLPLIVNDVWEQMP